MTSTLHTASTLALLAVCSFASSAQEPDRKPAAERPKSERAPEAPVPPFETLVRTLPDKVEMSADLYRLEGAAANAPVLVCMHMTASSRAEYRPYAAKMLELGCRVLSVDLRCGGEGERGVRGSQKRVGTPNATWTSAKSVLGRDPGYVDAYPDVGVAVAWAKELFPGAPIGLVGSSYSATLALVYAAEHPDAVGAVLALSPGDYVAEWKPVSERIKSIRTPAYITCGNTPADTDHAKPIAAAIVDTSRLITFWPQDEGVVGHHGTMTFAVPEADSRAKQWAMFARGLEPLRTVKADAPTKPEAPAKKD